MNLDLVVSTPHLPAGGETVLGTDVVFRPGGKGANQAVAACRMGAVVSMFGACGDDPFGEDITASLQREGVDLSQVTTFADTPSGVALIVVRPDGQNTVTVAPGANRCLDVDQLAALPQSLDGCDALLMQLETPLPTSLAAAAHARERGVRVILNAAPLPPSPEPILEDLLGLVDVLVVNESEAAELAGVAPPSRPEDWAPIASGLRKLGPPTVVVTIGERGAVAAADGETHIQPPFEVTPVDGTGAGDACCGAFAVAMAQGLDLPDALLRACAAGALATTRVGAQAALPTTAEVAALVDASTGRR